MILLLKLFCAVLAINWLCGKAEFNAKQELIALLIFILGILLGGMAR